MVQLQSEKSCSTPPVRYFFDEYVINCGYVSHRIDATSDDGSMGRIVNDVDWCTQANCRVKLIEVDKLAPAIAFFATEDLPRNTELRYDYGSKNAWWRKVSIICLLVKAN